MTPRRLTITEANNGFIFEWEEELNDVCPECKQHRIEKDFSCIQDIKGEKLTMTKLLEFVAEHFSTYETQYNGFSKTNLNIKWNKKGDEV